MRMAFRVAEVDRAMLESWLRAPTVAQDLALRAKIILARSEGKSYAEWRGRFGFHQTNGREVACTLCGKWPRRATG